MKKNSIQGHEEGSNNVVGFKYIVKTRLKGMKFYDGIQTANKYLNLNFFGDIGGAML